MDLKRISKEECLKYLQAIYHSPKSPEVGMLIEACREYVRTIALNYYDRQVCDRPLLATIRKDDFADTASQETAVRFWLRGCRGELYCGGGIRTILYSIFKNVRFEVERKLSDRVKPDTEDGLDPESLGDNPAIDELVNEQEDVAGIKRCLQRLTVQQRYVFDRFLENPDVKVVDIANSLNVAPQRVSQLRKQVQENFVKCLFRDRLLEKFPGMANFIEFVHESIGVCYAVGLLESAAVERENAPRVGDFGAGSRGALRVGAKLAIEAQDDALEEHIARILRERDEQGVEDEMVRTGWQGLSSVQKRVLLLALHCDQPVIVGRDRVRLRKQEKVSRGR